MLMEQCVDALQHLRQLQMDHNGSVADVIEQLAATLWARRPRHADPSQPLIARCT
jgi:inhibitor of KinA sporulation pathway (predicted exonuclease)